MKKLKINAKKLSALVAELHRDMTTESARCLSTSICIGKTGELQFILKATRDEDDFHPIHKPNICVKES